MRRRCTTCPWRVGASTDAIPNYDPNQHRELANTIAEPGSLRGLGGPLRVMACHYSSEGRDLPCVGWVANQLGPGNNIALRLQAAVNPALQNLKTVGPQRTTFEETFTRSRR